MSTSNSSKKYTTDLGNRMLSKHLPVMIFLSWKTTSKKFRDTILQKHG